jgi:hypothetical protein
VARLACRAIVVKRGLVEHANGDARVHVRQAETLKATAIDVGGRQSGPLSFVLDAAPTSAHKSHATRSGFES